MTELAREATLAIGLVTILLGSMWVATGSFPPMVVVESGSMMHEDEGSVGAIDPGDLILVMNPDRVEIVTYVESTEEGNENFGYESHGMAGDVIIYRKNKHGKEAVWSVVKMKLGWYLCDVLAVVSIIRA